MRAHAQPVADVDAALGQPLHLAPQHERVDHHAVAERTDRVLVQHAAGHQVERERLPGVDDRMPGVVATLVANDQVGPLGEQVDQLALALVAPLGTDEHRRGSGHQVTSP